ncbi:MAG TPA: hypothetical protein VMW78_04815 [Anaerolineae bacterium]|nr:hypothetical protein [Anaerolineae bacterium]
MKKILWALSVVLILLIATGAYADTGSDKCNTYSNDLGISAAIDSYSRDIGVCAGMGMTGCRTNAYLLDTDADLPYRALLAKEVNQLRGPTPYRRKRTRTNRG